MKRSKKYTAAVAKVDKNKKYALEEAMALMPEISTTKFPGSVTVQIFLNLNEKQKKDSIRGSYTMPNTFGKSIKVLVVAEKADAEKAKDADIFGGEELFKEIEAGTLDFDVVVTTPMMMPKLARLGKTLGSKGLMPNPKNGTISNDLAGTIAKFKQGMKNFKSVDAAPISAVVGKTDMAAAKLVENFNAFIKAVMAELKKYGANPVKSIILSPTMGPKLNIDVNKVTV
jgi:large subunit ribosomal protein L1